jgi:hypothetical protein
MQRLALQAFEALLLGFEGAPRAQAVAGIFG